MSATEGRRPFIFAALVGSLTGALVGILAAGFYFGSPWFAFFFCGLPPGVLAGGLTLLRIDRRRKVWVVTAVLFAGFASMVTIIALELGVGLFQLESWIWALAASLWLISIGATAKAFRYQRSE